MDLLRRYLINHSMPTWRRPRVHYTYSDTTGTTATWNAKIHVEPKQDLNLLRAYIKLQEKQLTQQKLMKSGLLFA